MVKISALPPEPAPSLTDSVPLYDAETGTTKKTTLANVGVALGSSSSWLTLGYAPNTVTANGNKSYTLVFNSINLTSGISPGMRLLLPRTVTAPTQCTSLNGTNQYYNKTSPAGMTFTDDFVVSAWVKLTSYGAISTIASRYNGTSGWLLFVQADGTVRLQGANAGSSNISNVSSYQSIPLNKWVHIAAQLDMSAFTATTTTSYIMLDGVNVPAAVARGGTNPTALIQAGNLEIGSNNGGSNPFPGKIAQVAIYSAKVTQATILASMNQTLTGSETNLVSAYTLSNDITDLTANNNDLTAQNSAVATNSDTPFTNPVTGTSVTAGTTNYGIIMAQTFSTNTTLTVQIPEGETLPTTGGIGTVSYSTQKIPYGFPGQKNKWRVATLVKTATVQNSPTGTTWYNLGPTSGTSGGHQLNAPIGEWQLGYEAIIYVGRSGSADGMGCQATLSRANNSETDTDMTCRVYLAVAGGTSGSTMGLARREKGYTLSSATTYYMNNRVGTAGSAADIQTNSAGTSGDTIIYADNAYL